MRLRVRLFLLVLLAVLPAIAIQFYTEFHLRRSREAEIQDEALNQARVVTASLSEIFEGSRQLLVALAQLPAVQALDAAHCGEALTTMLRELSVYSVIAVAGRDGRVVCVGGDVSSEPSAMDIQSYFRGTFTAGGFVIGNFATSPTTDTKVLHVALPIARGMETVGVLVAGIDLHWLERHFRRRLPPGSVLLVADHNGTILLDLPSAVPRVGEKLPAAHQADIRDDRSRTVELTDPDGVDRVFAYVPMNYLPAGAVVAVGLEKRAALAPIEVATARGVALILFALAAGFVGAWLVGRHFVQRPVSALLDATRRWQHGDYSARAQLGEDSSEIGQLGRAFDEMAERLQEHLRQKDMLFREVNHRTMNSLQLLSSVLALQRRRILDPTARDQFEDARRRVQSMAMVHRRLYRREGAETLDFGQFLRELCAEIARSFAPADGPPQVSVESIPVQLETGRVIPLALIVFELLTNAFKYARPAAGPRDLRVCCALAPEGRLAITVADNGPGLPPDFEQRAGLGMKLVQTLVGQVRGTLSHSSDEKGTRFVVLLPLQPAAVPRADEKSRP